MFRKTLALVLAVIMLLFVFCSCKKDGASDSAMSNTESGTEPQIELSYTEENAVLLSGDTCYRVVYADGVPPLSAANLRNRLATLDESETAEYKIDTDKNLPDDGSPEILIGLTNRALSQTAKDMLESPLDYSIVISENKIAIYAFTTDALNKALTYFKSQLVVNEIGQVFYAQKDNYINKAENLSTSDLTIDGAPISDFSVIVPKDADTKTLSAADKIATLLMEKTGAFITIKDDSAAETKNEILVGKTNRAESASITEDPIDVGGDYRVMVKNQKLAIVASGTNGYNNGLSYLTKLLTGKSITEKHSVNSLSLSKIESITFGAVYLDKAADGVYFHKCSRNQMQQWAKYGDKGIGEGATYSTGIRLDFYTDSAFFAFRIAPNSGTKFELHINGEYVKTLSADKNNSLVEELDNSKGENRVTLLFPSFSKGALSSVQLSEGATVTPYTYSTSILFMGDSITHGHGTSFDSHSYSQLTTKYFDADGIIQGVGGGDFNASTIDPDLDIDPEYVIISFGCNDWNRNKTNESGFRTKLTEYMDKVKATYPSATVIYITPIPRRDYDNVLKDYDMSLAETRSIIAEEAAKRGAYSINGTELLPDDGQYYSDPLHPNTKGHELYSKNLCEALEQYIK
ncbi:MAG: SGNH/GDSL hydrolase family protein [Ruminococcaceae bacterium]|nr:SGNH/GDSL hydrolase family protein [Oscillospiraceae bacterium]